MWRWGWAIMLATGWSSPVWSQPPGEPSTILIEAQSGTVLAESMADVPKRAGSFGELLVLLLALERSVIEALPLDALVTVSGDASGRASSASTAPRMPLRTDVVYRLSDLIKATLMSGAASAAVGVAEAIAGSVPLCLEAMNARAALLGLSATHFSQLGGGSTDIAVNSPEEGRTSARDLARLARALVVHPAVLEWASLKGVPFDGGTMPLRNGNPMVGTVRGVDGLRASPEGEPPGVVATAKRGPLRLIAVVLDSPDRATAFRVATNLLELGFARYRRIDVVDHGERLKLSVRVSGGSTDSVVPVTSGAYSVLRPVADSSRISIRYQVPEIIDAPLRAGEPVGDLIIESGGNLIAVVPVVSPEAVSRSGLLTVLGR